MFREGQNSNGRFLRRASFIAALLATICLNACSTVHLNAIPPPPPSAKLRVFVQVISEEPQDRRIDSPWRYALPSDEWERMMTTGVDRYLQATGVYEVISKEETQAVLGTRISGSEQYWWVKKDYALLRQAGRALYADYAIIIIRTCTFGVAYNMVLINIETGKQYTASDAPSATTSSFVGIKRAAILHLYRKLFYDAKGDLLATAVRKGRLMPGEEDKKPAPRETKIALAPPPVPQIVPVPPPELGAADKRKEFEKKLEHEMQTETPATDRTKLVVYDFDTIERLNVVALILTHALREELFILGQFSLVNRENMMQVMQELKLQHSGLVAEKEIVELGKWLAANQAVTGRLAMLGNSYVLQVERTDIKTMGTLGLGTLKCSSGQEEELLSGMPILARKLIESKK
jgi:hypothetical protein